MIKERVLKWKAKKIISQAHPSSATLALSKVDKIIQATELAEKKTKTSKHRSSHQMPRPKHLDLYIQIGQTAKKR